MAFPVAQLASPIRIPEVNERKFNEGLTVTVEENQEGVVKHPRAAAVEVNIGPGLEEAMGRDVAGIWCTCGSGRGLLPGSCGWGGGGVRVGGMQSLSNLSRAGREPGNENITSSPLFLISSCASQGLSPI